MVSREKELIKKEVGDLARRAVQTELGRIGNKRLFRYIDEKVERQIKRIEKDKFEPLLQRVLELLKSYDT